ncbi:MAG TPA: GTPase HflX, partial [Methyloceanibacter sp.]|nr:GTPase HflX [Methyloceanibacter sp.]
MRPNEPRALRQQKRPARDAREPLARKEPARAVVLAPVIDIDGRKRSQAQKADERSPAARLAEAVGLATAIDLDVRASGVVPVKKPQPATLFGSGKVEELA